MPRVIKCELCQDRRHRRLDGGIWCKCSCLIEEELQTYMSRILPKEKWEKYPELINSLFWPHVKQGGQPGELSVILDPSDSKFDTFYPHLKFALKQSYLKRIKAGLKPLTCKIIHPDDVTGVRFDKDKGHEDKKTELLRPDILILLAATWIPYTVFWHELELLVKNRAQLGGNTWIVSNDFAKIKTYPQCPGSFHEFVKKMEIIRIGKSDLPGLIKSNEKGEKKAVLTVKGMGVSGLDSKLWTSQDSRTVIMEKELRKHESDGDDS